MTQEIKNEVIKSMAYGLTDTQIADVMGVEAADIATIRMNSGAEIEAEAKFLREMGWM